MTCLFCGGEERVALADIFADGAFAIETCCDGLHEFLCAQDEAAWREQLLELGINDLTGQRLRRVLPESEGLVLDYKLTIRPVRLAEARAFVARHHAHASSPPIGWRFGASVWNGFGVIGVAMVGRPVARMLDASRIVEVNRLCVRRDVPAGLRHCACSMLYSWSAREARKRNFSEIITYTLADSEPGTSLIAAGWQRDAVTRGGTWSRASRPRIDKAPITAKVRWRRRL